MPCPQAASQHAVEEEAHGGTRDPSPPTAAGACAATVAEEASSGACAVARLAADAATVLQVGLGLQLQTICRTPAAAVSQQAVLGDRDGAARAEDGQPDCG